MITAGTFTLSSGDILEEIDQRKRSEVVCDFCGEKLPAIGRGVKDRRRYCSKVCQGRASQGRAKVRLAAPRSKRYSTTLKFSDPLYFN